MTVDEEPQDDVLASVARLKPRDVSSRHAHRLRRLCHAALQTPSGRHTAAVAARGMFFSRVVGPALGGAWCLAYLMEIVRRAAAMYLLHP